MMPEAMMGVLRLLGAMAGIAVMLVLLIVAIWTAMWAVLLVVRHVPMVGRRYLATKPTR